MLEFFEKGLRANNTIVHAALAHGKTVISNLDAYTPDDLPLMVTDVDELVAWPRSYHYYNWDNLIAEMKGVCERSRSVSA